eukprot:403343537
MQLQQQHTKQIQSKLQPPSKIKQSQTQSSSTIHDLNPTRMQSQPSLYNQEENKQKTVYHNQNEIMNQKIQPQKNSNINLSQKMKSLVFQSESFLNGISSGSHINQISNFNTSASMISNKLTDTTQNSFLQQQNSHFSVASRPKQQLPPQPNSTTIDKNYNVNNRYQSQQQHMKQQQDGVQKRSPLRFRPVSPPQVQNGANMNTSNTSQSPGRIIPMNQIKIVHSPQPSTANQNQNSISPLIYCKQQQKASSPPQANHHNSSKTQSNNLAFGLQVSNFESQNIQQKDSQKQQQQSQYQLMRDKAHQRRRSGNNSRQKSIFEAPKSLVFDKIDLSDCNTNNNFGFKEQEEDEDCCQVTDENEEKSSSQLNIPINSHDVKKLSTLELEIKNHQLYQHQEPITEKSSLQEQLRKSLTDYCENQKSNSKQNSRNAKSRNNAGGPTSINELQSQSLRTFNNNILQTELTKQSSIPSTNSIIQSSLPLMNEGKSFFLNKVKHTGNTNPNLTVNFATSSTYATQNLLDKQTFGGLNPTKSFNTQNNLALQQANSNTLCHTNRSGSNQSETFDLEMKKHGLIHDLKKLDSFNQFIEKHSPKQSRQNSCSYIGDNLGGEGSYDSFRAPYIQNAKFKRAGSGDLIYNPNLNSSNLELPQVQRFDDNKKIEVGSSNQAIGFQFPFQRRARSNSPPKQLVVQNVIQQKLIECMSPLNKGVMNHNGSVLEQHISVDQSQQSLLIPGNTSKRTGPIKAQQNSNFLFGSSSNLQNQNDNDWDFNGNQLNQLDHSQQSNLQSLMQPEKFSKLAQAIQLYLNGDYQKILADNNYPLNLNDNENQGDISCDPDQMMKQSTDVDEWLLSGTSENETYMKESSSKGVMMLERDEEEENMIMRKIEENQIKQAQSGTEKTYIIDDIDEDLIYVQPLNNNPLQNLIDKTYIKGDRRVTTVVEQQTWEDMEDDYDDEQNVANIVMQYEQMKSSSSGDKTLKSYSNSLNDSPDCQITSSEFRISHQNNYENYDIQEENVEDEDEELVQSADLTSYEKIPDISTFRSNASVTPTSMIDLTSSQYSCNDPKQEVKNSEVGEDWMFKTFDNSKQLKQVIKSSQSTTGFSQTSQQPLNNQLKGILTGIQIGQQSSRNQVQQVSQHKSQQNNLPTSNLLTASQPQKESVKNINQQNEQKQTKVINTTKSKATQNINQIPRKFPVRQSPREVKIDLVILQSDNGSAKSSKQLPHQSQNSGKSEKKTVSKTSQMISSNTTSNYLTSKKSPGQKSNKENKQQANFNSSQSKVELIQQPKTSQPNKFMSKNARTSLEQNSSSIAQKKQVTPYNPTTSKQDKSSLLHSKQSLKQHQSEKPIQPQPLINHSVSQFNANVKPAPQESQINLQTNASNPTNNTATQSHHTMMLQKANHRRQTSGSGHRHRRTQSTAFDPNFLEQIRNSEYDPQAM